MTSATTAIPVRSDVHFDFARTTSRHFAENPMTSNLWNAISILTPHTEAFLIRAMKRVRKEVTDTALREQVDAFLRQEALHTRQHQALNSRLGELGYDVEAASAIAESAIDALDDGDRRSALELVIAGEYAIYALARVGLSEPDVFEPMLPEVRRLFVWHALEEMEHQSVAQEVYEHLYGCSQLDRLRHIRALVRVCHVLVLATLRGCDVLMRSEPAVERSHHRRHTLYLFLAPALVPRVFARLVRFALPGFQHWASPRDRELIRGGLEVVYAEGAQEPVGP